LKKNSSRADPLCLQMDRVAALGVIGDEKIRRIQTFGDAALIRGDH